MKLYRDKAGNTLHVNAGKIFAKNAEGKIVNKEGFNVLLKRFSTKVRR
jgi:hypothetical protein